MRYLVTGASGMLGSDLVATLAERDVTALGRGDLDITDLAAVREAVTGHDVVLNAAGFTRVDDAETNEAAALAVNGTGAGNLAQATAETGAMLVQYSTDYVFDGSATSPYAENSPVAPVTAYGRTKAEGEREALEFAPGGTYILRTAWLYGRHGTNFASTMLRFASERATVSVITDQVGQPTWTMDLAAQTVALLDSEAPVGIYHATNSGSASWYEFARAIFETAGLDPERVLPTDGSEYVRPARRPAYSVLGHDAWSTAGLSPMRPWRDALAAAFSAGALTI
jgi:dTDP-4-dehydrorhamnose reductase